MDWPVIRELAWIFLIYAFLGWCTEVVFAAVNSGKFVNRGFLNGPVCPIYGFGVLTVVRLLRPFTENILLLFAGSVLITTILEFITGFLLEKLFHQKWWDYSDVPFNLKGYVCLKFSLLWGLACMFIVKIIHPLVLRFIQILPGTVSTILCAIFLSAAVTDFILTLVNILRLPKKLRTMSEIEKALNSVSENIGGKLSNRAISLNSRAEEWKAKGEADREALKEKYNKLAANSNFIHKRIIKAYPNIKNGRYKDSIEQLLKKQTEKKAQKKSEKASGKK
ncbi:MAG: putative ABC transporter permease [Clostridia bacterium]